MATCPAMVTLAALHMASVAAIVAISPLVSTSPSASLIAAILIVLRLVCCELANGACGRLALGQDGADVFVRSRDDLHADDLADPAGRGGPGVDRGFHRRHVADHERG